MRRTDGARACLLSTRELRFPFLIPTNQSKNMIDQDTKEVVSYLSQIRLRAIEVYMGYSYHLNNPLFTPEFEAQQTKVNIKVWEMGQDGDRRCIHSFIRRETGDIYFPAGCNKPAKHVRGNIFSSTNGAESFSSSGYGIRYLR